MRYTYSRWDGSQHHAGIDADAVMDALSDDLMVDGDVQSAVQRVVRWGLPGSQCGPNLQDLIDRLRQQRQNELERYDLQSIMQDIADRVDDVIQTERDSIEERLRDSSTPSVARHALERLAERKQSFFDALPEGPGPSVAALSDYEFLDEEARLKFEALEDMLARHMLERHFRSMERSLGALDHADLDDLKEMLRGLNTVLSDHIEGRPADLDHFLRQHGAHFPGIRTLPELIGELRQQTTHAQALMESMAPEMRHSLENLVGPALHDAALAEEIGKLSDALDLLAPRRPPLDYPFSGDETVTLDEALRLMRRMADFDRLEADLKNAKETGVLDSVHPDRVREVMGEEAASAVDHLVSLTDVLRDAGYVDEETLELTARGVRRIGQKALQDIFGQLKRDAFGEHMAQFGGTGGEPGADTRHHEFGAPFLLDLNKTLMNAALRQRGPALKLLVEDFEVFQPEHLTQAATVLMLDLSRSMPLRGCFVAAKKVALALNSLIRTQFPHDRLYIVGFSDYARLLEPESLHRLTWTDYVYGTNMQHGFLMARRLLGRHKTGTRQIILITDGEPTAHCEGNRVQFAYPPTFRTFQETLREAKRCTQEGIVINTFMLERSHYLADFVTQLTRVNQGRAFFATPERLGDYVLVDYVRRKAGSSGA